jgi:hypothetical protein
MHAHEDFREKRMGRMFRRGGPFGEDFRGFGPFFNPEGPESPFDEKKSEKPDNTED